MSQPQAHVRVPEAKAMRSVTRDSTVGFSIVFAEINVDRMNKEKNKTSTYRR